MLDLVTPYVTAFRRARDMLRNYGEVSNLRIRIIHVREGRQNTRLSAEEVMGLIVGDGIEQFGPQDVILQTSNGTL